MEYYAYIPDRKWCMKELAKVSLVCVIVSYLFYDRLYVAPMLFPLGIYLWKSDRQSFKKERKNQLRYEFKEFIILLSGSLGAGYSLEQAIRRSYDDMAQNKEFLLMPKEIALLINGLNLNRNPEELLTEMGKRCQEENIEEFARLVSTAKKYGGNINTLIGKTKSKLNEKLMVDKEIETLVAAKRLEGSVMVLMPFGIMAYMRLTNSVYITSMYQTILGETVLTLSLFVVMVCGLIIKKITDIEV